ncbi:AIM24 family protein [Massilibacteroides sp.]|uniref:AIM24 family protein n=1 Tax=Massilibacteroides sp. TaxID=2034766 RepID=UPI002636F333|nr:AIM24 family protein [Massilibacteroides sp.]MDD4514398.1 AIM24 family protein [Massilibacteroides sp.]
MKKYSIQSLVQETIQDDLKNGLFELEKEYILELNINSQTVMIKKGAMIAYDGNVKFEREGIFSKGIGNLLKKAVGGEGTSMMKATGSGRIYVADCAKKIRVLYLDNESIHVSGNDILAHEESLKSDVKLMKSVAGIVGGGLFQVGISGTGHVAITTHGDPLTLLVKPGRPIYTDPNATVAWSGNLTPEFKTDISFKTFIGRGSGESFQMKFEGDGWVIVQPYEEVYGAE